MLVSEVAKKYGLSAHTLRYYEKIGLLGAVGRTSGGIRDFSENDCARLEFVKCMRGAGVQIDPLREYIRLLDDGPSSIDARKRILLDQREKIASRVAEMEALLEKLDFKIANYEGHVQPAENRLVSGGNSNGHQSSPNHRKREQGG
jgi:DNA-binding transcriptional MerR regulator